MTRHTHEPDVSGSAPPQGPPASPDLTVVVCDLGDDAVGVQRTLDSVRSQTLSTTRYEVVVVASRRDDTTAAQSSGAVAGTRVLSAAHLSLPSARSVGLDAARGRHTVFVEPGDTLSSGALEWLLGHASPEVSPLARRVGPDPVVAAGAGGPSRARRRARLLSVLAGRLLETESARRTGFDEALVHGADEVHGLEAWSSGRFRLRVAGPADDADYLPRPADDPRAPGPADLHGPLGVVEDLTRRRVSDPGVREVRDLMVERAADALRRVLVDSPELHADLVEEVRRRRVPRMPWHVVNRGRATQVALLFCHPPFLDPSSIVGAKRLTQLGQVTDVVSQDLATLREQDPGAARICSEYVDRTTMLAGVRRFDDWTAVRDFAEEALARVVSREVEHGPYASMYSRALAVHSHFAAALVKLRSPDLHWVAEFSDPLLRNAHGGWREEEMEDDWLRRRLAAALRAAGHEVPTSNRIFEWGELLVYAFADEIIFTNSNQQDFMLGYCADRRLAERAALHSRAAHHPVPPPHLYRAARAPYRLPPTKVHLGYFGNFYVNRGLEDLTEAIGALSPAERGRLQLHIFTDNPEPLVLETLEHGLSDVIVVNPLLGFLPYLNVLPQFDVLLITDFATREHYDPNPYLPSKLSDYRGSGTPIWAMVEPRSILSGVETEFRSPLGDAAAAHEVLSRILAPRDPSRPWRQVFGDHAARTEAGG